MRKRYLGAALVLAMVWAASCSQQVAGPGSDYAPEKPARAGSIEDLCAKAWEHEKGVFAFYPQGQVQFQPPIEGTQAFTGGYAMQEGVLDVTIMGFPPLKGTWDGTTLIIDGQECVPRGMGP